MTATPNGPIVIPVTDEALGNTSYLAALDDERAIVVDPRRDVDDHLAVARRLGVTITAVFETHLHADFVGGAREIADATGATIYAAADARLGYPFEPVEGGHVLSFGEATVSVLGTPGHTPEHVSYLLTGGVSPGVFSGGCLIAGGAARTDLSGPERTEALTRAQYRSLRELAALPDEVMLHPTHGAGSFCSAGPAAAAPGTIARERETNPLLSITDEDAFVEAFMAGFTSYPRYFDHLREVNRQGAPLVRDLAVPEAMEPKAARDAIAAGAIPVDVRPVAAWAASHPAGAISIELRPAFASWLGWVIPFGRPIILITESADAAEAIRLSRRIGYDDVRGLMTFAAWRDAGLPVASVESIGPAEAERRLKGGSMLLDVRSHAEYRAGHLPGARHLELGDIIAGKTPPEADVIVYCGHGERSATAASLLEQRGFSVANLADGTGAWRAWERDR